MDISCRKQIYKEIKIEFKGLLVLKDRFVQQKLKTIEKCTLASLSSMRTAALS